MSSNFRQLRILYFLIIRDIITIKEDIASVIVDSFFWPFRNIINFGYILVGANLSTAFGSFFFIGMIPSVAIFKITHGLAKILYDFQGDRIVDFELTLPISSNLLFLRKSFILGIKSMVFSLPVIPIGIIMLNTRFENIDIKYFNLILFFIIYNFLIGFIVLWLSGWVKNSSYISSLWSRYIHTFWIFGCVLFPWKVFYLLYPTWATLDLLNPVTYIMEGLRSATLISTDYINFWISFFMVLAFSIFFGIHGLYLIKKRLDVVR